MMIRMIRLWSFLLCLEFCSAETLVRRHIVNDRGILHSHGNTSERQRRAARQNPPISVTPKDLWAIHDLLILGDTPPLLDKGHAGIPLVKDAAVALGDMLGTIHPVHACRSAIAGVTGIKAKAKAAWSCLGVSATDFDAVVTPGTAHPGGSKFNRDVGNPEPSFTLGACQGSHWPRGCSYWVSAHSLAVLAEANNMGTKFFQAFMRIIAGGALYCHGCTSHHLLLNTHFLPSALKSADNLRFY
jgi:hypothetical protein